MNDSYSLFMNRSGRQWSALTRISPFTLKKFGGVVVGGVGLESTTKGTQAGGGVRAGRDPAATEGTLAVVTQRDGKEAPERRADADGGARGVGVDRGQVGLLVEQVIQQAVESLVHREQRLYQPATSREKPPSSCVESRLLQMGVPVGREGWW
jgi:hypothetical protein